MIAPNRSITTGGDTEPAGAIMPPEAEEVEALADQVEHVHQLMLRLAELFLEMEVVRQADALAAQVKDARPRLHWFRR